jgi:hypothetical protein
MGVEHLRRPWTARLLLGGAVLTLVLAFTLERMGLHTTTHDEEGGGGGGGCPLGYGSQKEGPREAATPGAAVRVFHDARIYTQADAAAEQAAFAEALGVDASGRVVATGSLQHVLKSAASDAELVGETHLPPGLGVSVLRSSRLREGLQTRRSPADGHG